MRRLVGGFLIACSIAGLILALTTKRPATSNMNPAPAGAIITSTPDGTPVVFEKSKVLAEDVANEPAFNGGTAVVTSFFSDHSGYRTKDEACTAMLHRWLEAAKKWDDDAEKGYPGERKDIDHTPYQLSREAVLCNPRWTMDGMTYQSCEDLKPERIAAQKAFWDLMGADIDAMNAAKHLAYEACSSGKEKK